MTFSFQLPSVSRILNIVIMVWVLCSSFMSHFLILSLVPSQIILCISLLFAVLRYVSLHCCITHLDPHSPPLCFYVAFVCSLFFCFPPVLYFVTPGHTQSRGSWQMLGPFLWLLHWESALAHKPYMYHRQSVLCKVGGQLLASQQFHIHPLY